MAKLTRKEKLEKLKKLRQLKKYKQDLAMYKNTQEVNRLRAKAQKMARNRPQRIAEARQKRFQEMPFGERFLSGMGATLYSTPGIKQAYDVVSGSPTPDYEAYKQASRGNIAAGLGEITGDLALMAGPARAATGLKAFRQAPKLAQYGMAGLGSAGLHQSQRLQSGRQLDPIEAGIEVGGSLILPGGGKYVGKPLAGKLKGAGEKIVQTALKAGTKVKGKKVMEGKILDDFMNKYLSFRGVLRSEELLDKQQDFLSKEFDALIKRSKGKEVDVLAAIDNAKTRVQRAAKVGEINLVQKDKILNNLDEIGVSVEPMLNENGKMSFKAAQRFKTGTLDEMANYDKAPKVGQKDPTLGPPAEASRAVRGKLVQRMAKQDPIFRPLNKQYKEMADIRPFVQQSADRVRANRGFSPQDIAALAFWSIGTGGIYPVLKAFPFLISRGQKSPMVAKTLYKMGKGIDVQGPIADEIKQYIAQSMRSIYAGRQ